MECKLLMMATNNIFSPSSGKPILTPSQDIVLGAYYLTIEPRTEAAAKGERVPLLMLLGSRKLLYAKRRRQRQGSHDLDPNLPNPDFGRDTVYGNKEKQGPPHHRRPRHLQPNLAERTRFTSTSPSRRAKLGDLILNTYKNCPPVTPP